MNHVIQDSYYQLETKHITVTVRTMKQTKHLTADKKKQAQVETQELYTSIPV